MALYQFYLESCEIMDTRSVHEDTIIAGIGVIVNGRVVTSPLVTQVGDHNNGRFAFWKQGLGSLDHVSIGPRDTFAFVYELFNNGHGGHPSKPELEAFVDRDLINARSNAAMSTLQFGGPVPPNEFIVLVPGNSWASSSPGLSAASLFEANYWSGGLFDAIRIAVGGCDGPLALGMILGTGAGLEQRIPAVGPLRIAGLHNAKKLNMGAPCNRAGSNYVINTIIQRH